MTEYKPRTIKEIILANTGSQNSFIDIDGHSKLQGCVDEITSNVKDTIISIINETSMSGRGIDQGIVQILKDSITKAVLRSKF